VKLSTYIYAAFLGAMSAASFACDHPVVGGACLEGYTQKGDRCIAPPSAGAGGSPALDCGTKAVCDMQCVDLQTDPNHCGVCSTACKSGVCQEGQCIGDFAGHSVALGIDYSTVSTGDPAARLLSNSVLLTPTSNPTVAEINAYTDSAAVLHVQDIVSHGAMKAGRTVTWVDANNAAGVEQVLSAPTTDVLLVHDLSSLSSANAATLGTSAALAMSRFLERGGVVVAWSSEAGAAPFQAFLSASAVLNVGPMQSDKGFLYVSDSLDAVAVGEPSPFPPSGAACGLTMTMPLLAGTSVVVKTQSGKPVVVHRTYTAPSKE
jgi:hypothetical protein